MSLNDQPLMENSMMNIEEVRKYYSGFTLAAEAGNNAFSYEQRSRREIFVPALIAGTPEDLACGREIVFSERVEGQESNHAGLEHFIYYYRPGNGQDIFILDNHNHAFFFWVWAFRKGLIQPASLLVHVDQHTDINEPPVYYEADRREDADLRQAFDYTQQVLNVGNFIKPALRPDFIQGHQYGLKIFKEVCVINTSEGLTREFGEPFVLDVDLDFFAPELRLDDHAFRVERIKHYLTRAAFVTIATSPYFMPQDKAIVIAREILGDAGEARL